MPPVPAIQHRQRLLSPLRSLPTPPAMRTPPAAFKALSPTPPATQHRQRLIVRSMPTPPSSPTPSSATEPSLPTPPATATPPAASYMHSMPTPRAPPTPPAAIGSPANTSAKPTPPAARSARSNTTGKMQKHRQRHIEGRSSRPSPATSLRRGFANRPPHNTASGYQALMPTTPAPEHRQRRTGAPSNNNGTHNTASGYSALETTPPGIKIPPAAPLRSLITPPATTTPPTDTARSRPTPPAIANTAIGVYSARRQHHRRPTTPRGHHALYNSHGFGNTALASNAGYNDNFIIFLRAMTTYISALLLNRTPPPNRTPSGSAPTNQTKTFIAGIYGAAVGGNPVMIDGWPARHEIPSRRDKEDIRDMGESSNGLLSSGRELSIKARVRRRPPHPAVRPHRRRGRRADPDLVLMTRRPTAPVGGLAPVNAMLLNDEQKQHRHIPAQEQIMLRRRKMIIGAGRK